MQDIREIKIRENEGTDVTFDALSATFDVHSDN